MFNIDALAIIFEYSLGLKNIKAIIDRALDGDTAIKMVKENVAKNHDKLCDYDIIFMDCNMPILDGYDSTRGIRQFLYSKKIKQPIIAAVTGHTE